MKNGRGMIVETLKWIGSIDGFLELTDQRKLPTQFEMLKCETTEQVYKAIKTLAVRGAPAIGVAAGYGLCIAMQQTEPDANLTEAVSVLNRSADYLASSRPTAVRSPSR